MTREATTVRLTEGCRRAGRQITRRTLPIVVLTTFLLAGLPAIAQKTDVLTLDNGDIITGEIKELDRGRVRLSTSFASTIYVEWEHVVQAISDKQLEVEVSDGRVFFGSLEIPSAPGLLKVVGIFGETELELLDVVKITPIKQKFWKRFDGYLSLGFDFTKASGVARLNFDSRADYRARNYSTGIWVYSTITAQETLETSRRQGLEYNYTRHLRSKRFWQGLTGAEQNTELGIDLRVYIGGTYGWMAKQTNRTRVLFSGGLQTTREFRADAEETNNLELPVRTNYEFFKYSTPKLSVNIDVSLIPSISDWGRLRTAFDGRVSWEMIKDLMWEISGYFSSDNRPPMGAIASTDYGIVTSIKWTF